ncbi:PadR family transcriptional regulator [Streptococcus sp. X16XC17]|uniref:PadR family transcriptional regulator n=1 Tax=unclassified Streptococcus TaxID=2608887 RepID=UPI00066FBC2A|nr:MULTISPECIES: PadR family transcriptional regulator [unclassified Streptococcus]TCD45772.1 PadR family transcriptional regulator [Streptococcus sp. X16XC17]
MDAQLLKGVLEGCVLGIVSQKETYGYEILSKIDQAGFQEICEGSLYPILTRLHKNGFISCRKAKSPLGPIRKYYAITSSGEKKLQSFYRDFEEIISAVNQIKEEK